MDWSTFLRAEGATFDESQAATFSNTAAQVTALENGAILAPLTHYGLIRLTGEESITFLHGQLSSDVKKLASPAWQYSTYSTPKGRMLASMIVLRQGDELMLQLPLPMVAGIQKRLSMFIMRSKTRAEDASTTYVAMGIAGPKAADLVAKVAGSTPSEIGSASAIQGGWIIRLSQTRFELILSSDAAQACWSSLIAAGAQAADAATWTLSDIREGIVWVLPATQEEFVPQMANMELVGAVNFKKGCYPGQEIVARTQYLGKLKRRAFRILSETALSAGQPIYSAEMNGQASGLVAMSAPLGDGRWEALVVAQISSVEQGLHLGSVDGPLLSPLPLPYALGDEAAS
jgi:folate-binding protein YgfZ